MAHDLIVSKVREVLNGTLLSETSTHTHLGVPAQAVSDAASLSRSYLRFLIHLSDDWKPLYTRKVRKKPDSATEHSEAALHIRSLRPERRSRPPLSAETVVSAYSVSVRTSSSSKNYPLYPNHFASMTHEFVVPMTWQVLSDTLICGEEFWGTLRMSWNYNNLRSELQQDGFMVGLGPLCIPPPDQTAVFCLTFLAFGAIFTYRFWAGTSTLGGTYTVTTYICRLSAALQARFCESVRVGIGTRFSSSSSQVQCDR